MAARLRDGYFAASVFLLLLSAPVQAQNLGGLIGGLAGQIVKEAVDAESQGDGADLSASERKAVQEALNSIDIQVGSPDGKFGAKTRRGIAAFQARHGFTPTGTLTQEQFDRLILAQEESRVAAAEEDSSDSTVSGDQIFARIGLQTRDGEVLVGSTAVGYDEYEEGIHRLELLLILAANPTLIDERNNTERFARILPLSILDEYMRAGGRSLYWKGDSEFEREDSRQRFLSEQRDAIMAMRPSLPLTIRDFRGVQTGSFDFDREQLPIDVSPYLPWVGLGFAGFEGDVPAVLPTAVDIATDDARAIVEGTFPGSENIGEDDRQLTAALRYVVKGMRQIDDGGVALDIGILDLKLYADRSGTVEIMDLPLGEGTIYAQREVAEPREVAAPPVLDDTLARLLAMKVEPSLKRDNAFIAHTYRLRREAEAGYLRDAGSVLHFDRVIPAVLLNDGRLEPGANDLDAFRTWIDESIQLAGDRFTFSRDLIWVHSNNRLSAVAGEADSTPSRDHEDRLRLHWPNSVEFGSRRVADDLLLLYALNPSPYWADESILGGLTSESASAHITVRIAEARMEIADGTRLLMLNLVPDFVTVVAHGEERRISLPEPENLARADDYEARVPASRFKVLGIGLGMQVEEARTIIEAAFEGKTMSALEVVAEETLSSCGVIERRGSRTIRSVQNEMGYVKSLGERDGTIDTAKMAALEEQLANARAALASELEEEGCQSPAASPLQFAFGYEIQHSKNLVERVVVYQVGELVGEPVVSAVYRQFTPDEIGDRFIEGLKDSFGQDFVDFDDGSDQVAWTDDPVYGPRFRSGGDERCTAFWQGDDSFPGQYLNVDCGAYIRAESWRMVLIDTRFTARVYAEQLNAGAAAEAAAEPDLQF